MTAMKETEWLVLSLVLVAVLGASSARANPLVEASNATTELDLQTAIGALRRVDADSPAVALERARLALYQGDCDAADAILSAPNLAQTREGAHLGAVARSCARALAGAVQVRDDEHEVWIRLQDARDRVLVSFIVRAAVQARDYLERELSIQLPRPLRVDLVRDLFSLAAVSGLPVEAAETTGTVGVARFGRILLVTPRATPRGYPWADTLAHEMVHLFVTRATRDHAPLWLQEGVAKLHESRWREPGPIDITPHYDATARGALLAGNAVGIGELGASIALLPSPELAAIAYAEVTSFLSYWVRSTGAPALRLLFADLRGMEEPDVDAALRSGTGYDLSAWIARWQNELGTQPPPDEGRERPVLTVRDAVGIRDVVRSVRLGDLLANRGHYEAAVQVLAPGLDSQSREPSIRWRVARAELALGKENEARAALGAPDDVDSEDGPWLALFGRLARQPDQRAAARRRSVALDPLDEDVACQGRFRRMVSRWPESVGGGPTLADAPLPQAGDWRELCRGAREIPRD